MDKILLNLKKIISFSVITFTLGCSKEKKISPPYNFKVVDFYSNAPIAHARAVLRNTVWPAGFIDTILGYTDQNGEFQYLCDKESNHTSGNYSYYSVYFVNQNWTYSSFALGCPDCIEVSKIHETSNYTVKLFQSSTVNLRIKRVSVDPYNLGASFCGFGVLPASRYITFDPINYFNDTLGQIHDTSIAVKSNTPLYLLSAVMFDCSGNGPFFHSNTVGNQSDTLSIGYNETKYYNFDY